MSEPSPPHDLAAAFDLSGRVAVVTGGTRGVGRGIVDRFLEAGAEVVTSARNAPEVPISAGGRSASFVTADVRDPDQAKAIVEAAVERHGRLDVVVNNAGGGPETDAATASPRFFEAIVKLNLLAAMYVAQAANAVMQGQDEGGSIINISSVSGMRPSPGTAAYGAAKAGLLSVTTSLAMEWGPKVRVNAVTPGYIATEWAQSHYGEEAGVASVARELPLKRMGTGADIGNACLFLASPMSSYVSGANIAVHGGGERPPFLAARDGSVGS